MLRDRQGGGVLELALGRDGIELAGTVRYTTDLLPAVLLHDRLHDGGVDGNKTQPVLRGPMHQRRIFKLRDDLRPDFLRFKPAFQSHAKRSILRGEQGGDVVKRLWEVAPQLGSEGGRGTEGDIAGA